MSVRFTSGAVGRFGFDEANATLNAADAMVGRFDDHGKPLKVEPPKAIVARLTQDLGTNFFDAGPQGTEYRVWNWVQIQIAKPSPKRKIQTAPNGKQAIKFGETPTGRAVQLGGRAMVGDHVILFRLMAEDGSVWFCFTGKPAVNGGTLLAITGADELSPGRYRYQVQPIYINAAGVTSPNPNLPSGFAFNTYELSGRHGQPLEFDDPPSRMSVIGPVDGPVVGVLSSDPELSQIVYAFEAPSPLEPDCIGPVPGAFGSLLGGNL